MLDLLEVQLGMLRGIKRFVRVRLFRTLTFSTFLTSLLITACIREEIVDFDYEELEPKLTIQCFLCPQFDTISVLVTQTVPWGEWFDYHEFHAKYGVYTAVVKLTKEDSDWEELTVDSSGFPMYSIATSELPIVSGQKYSIEVSAPGFETVTGSTTIPDTLAYWSQIDTIGRFKNSIESQGYQIKMNFKGQWDDVEGNYGYSVFKQHIYNIEQASPPSNLGGNGFINSLDIRKSGNKYVVYTEGWLYNSHFPPLPKNHRFYFYLVSGNEDFDGYQKAIIPYLNDDLGTGDVLGSSLFNSVIPKYYTNLSGGFGTFSAFRYTVDSIDIIQ